MTHAAELIMQGPTHTISSHTPSEFSVPKASLQSGTPTLSMLKATISLASNFNDSQTCYVDACLPMQVCQRVQPVSS